MPFEIVLVNQFRLTHPHFPHTGPPHTQHIVPLDVYAHLESNHGMLWVSIQYYPGNIPY